MLNEWKMIEFLNEINIIAMIIWTTAIISVLYGAIDWIVAFLFIVSTLTFTIHLRRG